MPRSRAIRPAASWWYLFCWRRATLPANFDVLGTPFVTGVSASATASHTSRRKRGAVHLSSPGARSRCSRSKSRSGHRSPKHAIASSGSLWEPCCWRVPRSLSAAPRTLCPKHRIRRQSQNRRPTCARHRSPSPLSSRVPRRGSTAAPSSSAMVRASTTDISCSSMARSHTLERTHPTRCLLMSSRSTRRAVSSARASSTRTRTSASIPCRTSPHTVTETRRRHPSPRRSAPNTPCGRRTRASSALSRVA